MKFQKHLHQPSGSRLGGCLGRWGHQHLDQVNMTDIPQEREQSGCQLCQNKIPRDVNEDQRDEMFTVLYTRSHDF